jgi:hypothetical protein
MNARDIQLLENGEYQLMCGLGYTRKPFDMDDIYVESRFDMNKPSAIEHIKNIIRQLPVSDAYKEMTEQGFFADELDGKQQFYVLELEDNKYALCDTQGFNYARYVLILDNFIPDNTSKKVFTVTEEEVIIRTSAYEIEAEDAEQALAKIMDCDGSRVLTHVSEEDGEYLADTSYNVEEGRWDWQARKAVK